MRISFFRAMSLATAAGLACFASARSFVEQAGVQEFTGEMIVRPLQADALRARGLSSAQAMRLQTLARQRLAGLVREYVSATDEYIVRVPLWSNENRFSSDLMATGAYQYAHPNWMLYPARVPNDPLFGQQWHHRTIQAIQAWDLWTGRSNFITAFVDTGILRTHPDLAANRIPGYNSVDRLPEVSGGNVDDINGHGTHVAGCGSAIGNNLTGVSGVGWNFRVMMVKTSNAPSGGASLDDIMAGARWAAENGAKTVSASYSGVDAEAVGTTGTYIKSRGSLFFYAAGNDARQLSVNYPDTVVVGASNPSDTRAGFSAYGAGIGVFAPGESILSSTNDGGYQFFSGTSMATPVANGATALMWSLNPRLTPNQIQQILYTTTDQIGPRSIFGNGRVNVFKGVRAVQATLAREFAPNGISTEIGTWVGGTLDQILNPGFAKYYEAASANMSSLGGHNAGIQVNFTADVNAVEVTGLEFVADASLSRSQPSTGMVFFWNYASGRYDMARAFPIQASGSAGIVSRPPAAARNYVGGSRQVRILVRSVTPTRLGTAYNLRLNYAKLALSSQ